MLCYISLAVPFSDPQGQNVLSRPKLDNVLMSMTPYFKRRPILVYKPSWTAAFRFKLITTVAMAALLVSCCFETLRQALPLRVLDLFAEVFFVLLHCSRICWRDDACDDSAVAILRYGPLDNDFAPLGSASKAGGSINLALAFIVLSD